MVGSSDSDSDIEIIATKEHKSKILSCKERDDIIKDLEDIEGQCGPSTLSDSKSDINISISKETIRKSKNIDITISIEDEDSEECEDPGDVVCVDSDPESQSTSSRLQVVMGKRKTEDDGKIKMKKIRTDNSKSTSELFVEKMSSKEPLSTSEMFIQGIQRSSSSSPTGDISGHEQTELKPIVKPISVRNCVESFLKSCKRLTPSDDFPPVSKKILKHLSKLDIKHHYNNDLKNFLDLKWSLLDNDKSNIYVHVKEVIEELKKYKSDLTSTTTSSDLSESDNVETKLLSHNTAGKKRVSLTTLSSVPGSRLKENNVNRDKDHLKTAEWRNPPDTKSPERKNCDEKLLISLSLEKKSAVKVSEVQTEDKTKLQVFNKNLTGSKSGDEGNEISSGCTSKKKPSEKHILKLEKALQVCAKQIEKCEEAEIDWDNDDESTFVLADKWKKKFMLIYNKLAQYKGTSNSLERSSDRKFKFEDSKFPEINKKIEKFVNKTKSFPDFWDVKKQIEKVNIDSSLNLTDMQMHNEAEKIFINVGKKLKKRRNIDDGTVMYSYLKPDDSGDPASEDPELDSRLKELGKVAEQKINTVFEQFVEKQASGKSNEELEKGDSEEEDTSDEEDNLNTLDSIDGANPDSKTAEECADGSDVINSDEDGSEDVAALAEEQSEISVSSSGSVNNLLEESDLE